MIGYVCLPRGGDSPTDAADRLLAGIAARLGAAGVPLAGAVQVNAGGGTGCVGEMRLTLLGVGEERVISQQLGGGASGCRLDPGALELAVARMAEALPAARLVIFNKFGKQEAAGRGIRPLVAEALELGLPVLLSVSPEVEVEFLDFAGDLARRLAPGEVEDWCRMALAEPA